MDWRTILRALREQGFRVEARHGHVLVRGLDGRVVAVAATTPGDVRSLRNLLATLRRAGLVWPWSGRSRRATRAHRGSHVRPTGPDGGPTGSNEVAAGGVATGTFPPCPRRAGGSADGARTDSYSDRRGGGRG